MSKLSELGEHEVIRRIIPRLGRHKELITGAGDDCAICRLPGGETDQVFTTDPVVEKIHFLAGEDPRRVGHKAVGRVLSDIAAMGAKPQWLLVNVVAPPDMEMTDLEQIYDGMNALCDRFGATIIGGDLAKGTGLELHLFGTGILPAGRGLLRSGAEVGDVILVTGPLGNSLSSGRHLDFIPRVDEGVFLRETGCVHAMMDVSDGLGTDLRHILAQSQVGAVLDAALIPKNGDLQSALFDGEDFELLLTVAEHDLAQLRLLWEARFGRGLSVIGKITADIGVLQLNDNGALRVIDSKAFEHFRDT